MEQFKYGELVEVRDYDYEEWIPAVYVGVLPGYNWYWTRAIDVNENSEVSPMRWKQIRKIQKPEPELIDIEQPETIEQRMDKFEAVFNGAVKHINEQLESIKNQLK